MIWGVVLALILAAPFVVEALRPAMTDEVRKAAPGRFATLSRGVTHYRWFGPARGPVIVCVHGLTTPSQVWERLADQLVGMGYRVLTYDLYGRGYSDRPPGRQGRGFFLTQLDEFIAHEGLSGDITLVGYSMGGAIATAYAAEHPARLRRVVLLAPGGIRHSLGRATWFIRDVPVLGDWLALTAFPRSHRRATEAERTQPGSVPGIVDIQQRELRYRGFVPAVVSSFRGMLNGDLEQDHRALAHAGLPVLAVWGGADTVIPVTAVGLLAEWNRTARQEVVEGAGHGLPYTHTDAVARAIAETEPAAG